MILLLQQFWPWLLMGIMCMYWGVTLINLDFHSWVKFLTGIFFNSFSEDTKKEKQQLAHTTLEEMADANPGCLILLAGFCMVMYGLVRWWS